MMAELTVTMPSEDWALMLRMLKRNCNPTNISFTEMMVWAELDKQIRPILRKGAVE